MKPEMRKTVLYKEWSDMRKSVCIEWYEKMLKEVLMNGGSMNIQHPCIAFGKRVKAGEFDGLSDEDYFHLLADVEEIASCWNAENYKTTLEVCQNALGKIKPSDETFHMLAEILAECYDKSMGSFAPENEIISPFFSENVFWKPDDK